jgi:hypothetical protein
MRARNVHGCKIVNSIGNLTRANTPLGMMLKRCVSFMHDVCLRIHNHLTGRAISYSVLKKSKQNPVLLIENYSLEQKCLIWWFPNDTFSPLQVFPSSAKWQLKYKIFDEDHDDAFFIPYPLDPFWHYSPIYESLHSEIIIFSPTVEITRVWNGSNLQIQDVLDTNSHNLANYIYQTFTWFLLKVNCTLLVSDKMKPRYPHIKTLPYTF